MAKCSVFILLIMICNNLPAQRADIGQLTKLNSDWLNLSVKKDPATIARIFADDFVLIAPKGAKMTKAAVLSNIMQQDLVSVNIDSIGIKLLTGNVGLVTCYATFFLKIDGKNVAGKNCYQDVYVKRKQQWFAVAAHVTLLSLQ